MLVTLINVLASPWQGLGFQGYFYLVSQGTRVKGFEQHPPGLQPERIRFVERLLLRQ